MDLSFLKNLDPEYYDYMNSIIDNKEIDDMHYTNNVYSNDIWKSSPHGKKHAIDVMRRADELITLIEKLKIDYPLIKRRIIKDKKELYFTIFVAAYLHDISSAIDRKQHGYGGAYVARPHLREAFENLPRKGRLLQVVSNFIFEHSPKSNTRCSSIGSSIVFLADKLDVSGERLLGQNKADFKDFVTLEVKSVKLEYSRRKIHIVVQLNSKVGMYRVENMYNYIDNHCHPMKKYLVIDTYYRGERIHRSKFT